MFCQKCRCALYSSEFDRKLCRDCEVDGFKAEIERLKKQLKAADQAAEDAIFHNEKYIEESDFYQRRAAAWKRCAKTLSDTVTKCFHGFIEKNEFIIIRNRDLDEIVHTKAPPDWREKWVHPTTEDKSEINQEKTTGSIEPKTKGNGFCQ